MNKVNRYILMVCLLQLMLLEKLHSQTLLTYEQKFQTTQKVFEKVFSAMGLLEAKPELILDNKRTSSVAYLKRNKDGSRTLAVEEKAFDICMSFGHQSEHALAFLIGHELGHFRYNHHWGKDFSSSFALADIEDKLTEASEKLGELKYFETQADHSGGVSCYLAGYDIRGIGDPLLRKVYKEYDLPEASAKYPTLTERIAITRQNDSIVSKLISVFEVANYATIAGEYAEALRCYEFILNKGFKSREIYNNAGVVAFLEAVEKTGKEQVKYVYPVELDLDSRLSKTSKGISDEVKRYIDKALEYFGIAIQLDKEYTVGHVNLACTYSLKGETADAQYYAQKAYKLAQAQNNQDQINNASILLAIIADQEQNTAQRDKYIGNAIEGNAGYMAEINKAIFSGQLASAFTYGKKRWSHKIKPPQSPASAGIRNESIEGVVDFSNAMENEEMDEISLQQNRSCFAMNYKNSVVYSIATDDNHELYFQKTGLNYNLSSANEIKIGQTESDLFKAYGIPDQVLNTGYSVFYVYSLARVAFEVKQEKVMGWVVFKRY